MQASSLQKKSQMNLKFSCFVPSVFAIENLKNAENVHNQVLPNVICKKTLQLEGIFALAFFISN